MYIPGKDIIIPKLEVDGNAIADFCCKWKVTEFALFGSILRDDFRPDSDVDVLVSFSQDAKWSLFDIVRMQRELKTLFGREVDLVQKSGLSNPSDVMKSSELKRRYIPLSNGCGQKWLIERILRSYCRGEALRQ